MLAHPGDVEVAAKDSEVIRGVRGRVLQVFSNKVMKCLKVLKADAVHVRIPKLCIATKTTNCNAMNAAPNGNSMD